MSFRDVFPDGRALIGMVHLEPLPGSPRHDAGKGMAHVVERAVADAAALEAGGMDGIMIENFGDSPFWPESVPPVTVAALTAAALRVRERVSLPIGINVLRNDVRSALAIAAVTGARFVRVNVHIGAVVTDQGLVQGRAHETLRTRAALGARDVAILADVAVKHSQPLGERAPLESEAREAAERGLADGLILTGTATGVPGAPWELKCVRDELPDVPVLAGSGVEPSTVGEFLEVADGVIVGSALEEEGVAGMPVDPDRVREFVRSAR